MINAENKCENILVLTIICQLQKYFHETSLASHSFSPISLDLFSLVQKYRQTFVSKIRGTSSICSSLFLFPSKYMLPVCQIFVNSLMTSGEKNNLAQNEITIITLKLNHKDDKMYQKPCPDE